MMYKGKAQNMVTGKEWTTMKYDSYEKAHMAAEKLANKHIPEGNAFIYVVDNSLDALNAEFDERWESGYYDWIGTDDEAMDQAKKAFSDEVARR